MANASTRGSTGTTASTRGGMIDSGDFPIVVISAIASVRGATSTTVTIKGK